MVSSLMEGTPKRWDTELLGDMFCKRDWLLVQSISLSIHMISDEHVWGYEVHGRELVCQVVVICWSLWVCGNDVVWKEGRAVGADIFCRGLGFLQAWREHHVRGRGVEAVGRQSQWVKPVRGKLKMNVEAAVDVGQNCMGFGWVIRDENEVFVAAKGCQ
nr:uncharacterized protein LOC109186242 [Ipomoea batatas]